MRWCAVIPVRVQKRERRETIKKDGVLVPENGNVTSSDGMKLIHNNNNKSPSEQSVQSKSEA